MHSLVSIVSGILTAAAFSGEKCSVFVFVSLVPLFVVGKRRQMAKNVALFAFSYYVILMLWLYRLTAMASPIWLTVGIVVIGLSMAFLYWLPFHVFKPKGILEIIAVFTLADMMPSFLGPLSFPWGRLGVILTPNPELIQIASMAGAVGVTAMIVAVNVLLAKAVRGWQPKYLLIAVFIVCGNYIYGSMVLKNPIEQRNALRVSAIQGGIGSMGKWQATTDETLERYFSLCEEALVQGGELLILPETAFPMTLKGEVLDRLLEFSSANQGEMIVGGFFREEDGRLYNSLVNLRNGTRYHKQKLVPYGEFAPFARFFGHTNNLSFGEEILLIQTEVATVGAMICYDSIFSPIMRQSVKDGASLLVVSSNDSWFEHTPALYQHHAHGIMRAVESHRYLVRSANTGITSVIDPYGRVVDTYPPYSSGVLTADVYLQENITPYVKFGDWVVYLALGYLLFRRLHA
ncbi:apolipoprotein N-acyltransferase [Anaerotignum sp.]|uniref:apolipoprotein N-acyltransferase n=1 Tax=Anaerotignum sp. TaxID=2039241 RepID=UPI00331B2931